MSFSQPSIDAIRHVVDEAMTSFFHQFYTTPEANPDRFQTPGRFGSFNLASNIFFHKHHKDTTDQYRTEM